MYKVNGGGPHSIRTALKPSPSPEQLAASCLLPHYPHQLTTSQSTIPMASALFPTNNGLVLLGSTPSESFHLYSELRSIFFTPKSKPSSNQTQSPTLSEKPKGGLFASFRKRKAPVPITIPSCNSDSESESDESDDFASAALPSPPPPYSTLPEFGTRLLSRPAPAITSLHGRITGERGLRKSRSYHF